MATVSAVALTSYLAVLESPDSRYACSLVVYLSYADVSATLGEWAIARLQAEATQQLCTLRQGAAHAGVKDLGTENKSLISIGRHYYIYE